jgi:hypothetical protein
MIVLNQRLNEKRLLKYLRENQMFMYKITYLCFKLLVHKFVKNIFQFLQVSMPTGAGKS